MCLTCNPYCGKCRPPARKAIKCPYCGHDNAFSRDECIAYLGYRKLKDPSLLKHGDTAPLCESCKEDIQAALREKVIPKECLYMGFTCGYPCGRHAVYKRSVDLCCVKPVPLKADKLL